jgi:hypothetical protein
VSSGSVVAVAMASAMVGAKCFMMAAK